MAASRGSDAAPEGPEVEPVRPGTQGEAKSGRRRASGGGRVTARGRDSAGEPAGAPEESVLDARQDRVKGRRKDPGPTRPDAPDADGDDTASDVPPTDPFA